MTNYTNRRIKIKFKELRKSFGGECQCYQLNGNEKCGCTENLHFAHRHEADKTFNGGELPARGRGRKERYYDIVKHPEKYILLTKEHHLEYDLGKYDKKEELIVEFENHS